MRAGGQRRALKRSLIPTLLCAIILIGVAVFVWPTRYRYDHMGIVGNNFPIRTDRLSGKTEWADPRGWHAIGNMAEDQKPYAELPTKQVARLLAGQACIQCPTPTAWDEYGTPVSFTDIGLEVSVYNGSKWKVSEITVLVTVLDAQKNRVLSRPYRLIRQGGDSVPQ